MNTISKKSHYIKNLSYEDGVECYLCSHPINVKLKYFMEDNRVNPLALSEDHVSARINGGVDSVENIKAVHAYCNFVKGKKNIGEVDLNKLKDAIKNFTVNSINGGGDSLIACFTCRNCGGMFTCEAARLSKYNKKYCSNKCKNSFLTSVGSALRECNNCGELFKVINSRLKEGRGRYCSMHCYNSFGDKRRLQCRLCARFYYLSVDNNRFSALNYCSSCRKNL